MERKKHLLAKKSLYDLNQASKAWNSHIDTTFKIWIAKQP